MKVDTGKATEQITERITGSAFEAINEPGHGFLEHLPIKWIRHPRPRLRGDWLRRGSKGIEKELDSCVRGNDGADTTDRKTEIRISPDSFVANIPGALIRFNPCLSV